MGLVEKLVALDIDILGIKDMAGNYIPSLFGFCPI